MKNYGFIRVAAAVNQARTADIDFNLVSIIRSAAKANEEGVSLVVFPELSLTGYTCGDLFSHKLLADEAEKAVKTLVQQSEGKDLTMVIGAPVTFKGRDRKSVV